MQVKANGIDIHYEIDGKEGAPWVTFVTGIANDTTMWDGQIPAIRDDFRILRYDLRGTKRHHEHDESPPRHH